MNRSPTAPTSGTRKRLWLRYSLRSLLAVMTASSLWLGLLRYPAARQRSVVAFLNEQGIEFRYDRWLADGWAPLWMVKLVGVDYFANVSGVWIEEMPADAPAGALREIIQQIARLQNLELVGLRNVRISPGDMRPLAASRKLRRVHLSGCRCSHVDLEAILEIETLSELAMFNMRVSRDSAADCGVANVRFVTMGAKPAPIFRLAGVETVHDVQDIDAFAAGLESLAHWIRQSRPDVNATFTFGNGLFAVGSD